MLIVAVKGSSAKITRCEFTDNYANMTGGAIYTMLDSTLDVYGSVFTNNTALNTSGGAIAIGHRSFASVATSVFSNGSSVFGSALYFFGLSNGSITSCPF